MIPALRVPTDRADRLDHALTWAAIGLGCVALAARQVGGAAFAVTIGVGALGLLVPGSGDRSPDRTVRWRRAAPALLLGLAAFAAARLLIVVPPQPRLLVPVAGNVVAAFAEEAFFRRLMFGRLVRWRPAVAVAVTALAFAVVHVPAYGSSAFLVDLAAGGVLGWQRWATGSWVAPGVTHAVANVLQMM